MASGLKVNGRLFVVQRAESEIHRFILDKMVEHDLTYIEELGQCPEVRTARGAPRRRQQGSISGS